jgi:ElaB/YqjD/DUF883 family membrane-anchored ribosome-binding protein
MQKKRKLQQAQNALIEIGNLVRNATELTKQIISKTKKISLNYRARISSLLEMSTQFFSQHQHLNAFLISKLL